VLDKKCNTHASAYGRKRVPRPPPSLQHSIAAITGTILQACPYKWSALVPGWLCARTYPGQKFLKIRCVTHAAENSARDFRKSRTVFDIFSRKWFGARIFLRI